jgi:YVTN family beta-propeller protein
VGEISMDGGCYMFAALDSAGGKAYYIGYDTGYIATAIDVARDSVVANIALGPDYVTAACFNTRNQKLYLTDKWRYSRRLSVVDTRGDSLLRTLTMARYPSALGYNPVENKVYCGYFSGVYVIDGESDTMIGAEHALPGGPGVIGCDPDANKVYCGIGGGESRDVYILDGSTDSTITVVQTGSGPREMLYDPLDSNMYVACGEGYELSVIDGRADSVVTHIAAGRFASWLTLDVARNRIYCAARDGLDVSVTQGSSVTPFGVIYTGFWPDKMCYDPAGDKVYVSNWERLGCVAVVDCNSNEVVAIVRVGQWPQSLCHNSPGDKIYCANSGWDSVGMISVIDASADTVLTTIITDPSPYDICYNADANHVYCGSSAYNVVVIDAGADTVAKRIAMPLVGTNLAYVPVFGRLYCSLPVSWDYYLGVIDSRAESLTAVLHCTGGPRPEAYVGHTGNGKVYFASTETLAILRAIDAKGDTLVPPTLRMTTQGSYLCWNSTNDKLYWAGGDSVTIIDCAADTIITAVEAGFSGLFYDSGYNRLYCSGQGTVTVIDGATDRVLTKIAAGPQASKMAYSPAQERLYVANWTGSSISVIRTSPSATSDQSPGQTRPDHILEPTMVNRRGVFFSARRAILFDASGRRAAVLQVGPNDISHLAPGVYFVKGEGRGAGDAGPIRKVVVTR